MKNLEEKIMWVYTALVPFSGAAYFYLGVKRVAYVDFLFFALFAAWVVKYLGGKAEFRKTLLEFPLILMAVLFSISFINSVNLFNSFTELAGLVYLIVLFVLINNIISSPQRLRYLLSVFLFTGTIVSAASLFSLGRAFINHDMVDSSFLFYNTLEATAHHFPRIKFTFETPNMMSTYLHAAIIAGIILFLLENKPKFRLLIFSSIAIILSAAFFTGSRRFTGLLLSLFVILCLFGRGRPAAVIKYACFLGFACFLAVSIITSIWVIFPANIEKDETSKTFRLNVNYAYSLHFIQPIASINMYKSHPFIGAGLGMYNTNFKNAVDWEWMRSSFGFEVYPQYVKSVEEKTLSFDPHSIFLGTLAETGTIGFLGLIYFFLRYMILLIKRFRRNVGYDSGRIVAGCVLAGFIGFLLNGLTTDILSMRHFWILMAIGISSLHINWDYKQC